MGIDLVNLQSTFRESGILICFSGHFSQGIIEEMSEAIRSHLENFDASKSEAYCVIAVFVEQTQNIKNYSSRQGNPASKEFIDASGIVIIGKNSDGFYINAGNPICNRDIAALQARLERIASMDKAALKQFYKEQMNAPFDPATGGAGLGLIDIARKASRPIEYSFKPYGDNYHFFSINVTV